MAAPPEHAHETRLRVRYGEVDRMGVVYHAHYLVYFEQGRTEYLRSLGGSYRALEEEGTLLVVTEATLSYRRSAGYDDELVVRTRLVSIGPVRLSFAYEVLRGDEVMATGTTVLAATDRTGRPVRLPEAFRRRVAPHGERRTPGRKVAGGPGVEEEGPRTQSRAEASPRG